MSEPYLILDCDYLCHRAQHVFSDMLDKGSATGAIYGFLCDLLRLRERFSTNRFLFCWDYGKSRRAVLWPDYKKTRATRTRSKERTPKEDMIWREALRTQKIQLRTKYLHTIGFRNIFFQNGYEADDIIAVICCDLPSREKAIIVTCDQDLYQCIRPNVSWFNPRKKELITDTRFHRKYGIPPGDWAKLKAITGCRSDDIPGVHGVGETLGLRFLQGSLDEKKKAYHNIRKNWKSVVLRNRPLVQLPFQGTKSVQIVEDDVTQVGWNAVTKELGMQSIRYRNIV